jgi:transcriptional regulator with XRE-family HTH domain
MTMGDVIGLGRKRPNGAKIKELRSQKGMKQETLAELADKMAVRVLRDIEQRNHPVPATTITAIANALQTTAEAITLSTPDGTPDSSGSLLKLRAIRSANDLSALASGAADFEWKLEADPNPVTAKDMQQLMMLVSRLVHPWEKDEFDEEPFGEIPRSARLQQLLEQLREQGVGVIASKYGRNSLVSTLGKDHFVTPLTPIPGKPKWSIKTHFTLCLHLVPAEKQEADIQIKPGNSLDRLLEVARHLPDDGQYYSWQNSTEIFCGGPEDHMSRAWHGLYKTKEGTFFAMMVDHDGETVLQFEPISNIEAKKLTEKYANDLVEKYFDVTEGESAERHHTNPPSE